MPTGTAHARAQRHVALGPKPVSGLQLYDTPKSRLLVEPLPGDAEGVDCLGAASAAVGGECALDLILQPPGRARDSGGRRRREKHGLDKNISTSTSRRLT